MIRRTVHCIVCFKPATRIVLDRPHNGRQVPMHLCDSCPDPSQVDSRAAEVRSHWSDETFVMKFHQCRLAGVPWYSEYHFDDHVAHVVSNGMVDRREYGDD